MSSQPDSQPLQPGAVVLDRYRVVEQLAAGGHSVVYRGQDERLSRPVCIKVFSRLPSEHGVSRASYEHFVQEAFALSRLTHPNTLRIYDFGHITVEREEKKGDVPFQVCEYMNGGTLAQVVRDHGPQKPAEGLRVVGAMCDALAEAHQLGIIHRDIKPQNILFAQLGATRLPKLADFGIAKWNDGDEPSGDKRAGDTQVVAGHKMAMYSPSWAAPEQLSGQKVSAATDIYSLAVVAIYTLTGNPIFACDDVYEGYRKRRNPAGLIRDAFATFDPPDEVIGVLVKAIAFAPEDRLAKIGDLVAALSEAFAPDDVDRTKPRTRSKERSAAGPTQALGEFPMPESPLAAGSSVANRRAPEALPLPPPPVIGTSPGLHAAETPPSGTSIAAVPPPPTMHTPAAGLPQLVPQQIGPNPGSGGPPRRVQVSPSPIAVADRMAHFAPLVQGACDVAEISAGIRLRVTWMGAIHGRPTVHLKPLTCFIVTPGGRASGAIQLFADGEFDLVNPRQQVMAKGRLSLGGPAAGHTVFQVGSESVALGLDECPEVMLIDFGPGRACHFIYTPGPGLQRTTPKRGQPRTNR